MVSAYRHTSRRARYVPHATYVVALGVIFSALAWLAPSTADAQARSDRDSVAASMEAASDYPDEVAVVRRRGPGARGLIIAGTMMIAASPIAAWATIIFAEKAGGLDAIAIGSAGLGVTVGAVLIPGIIMLAVGMRRPLRLVEQHLPARGMWRVTPYAGPFGGGLAATLTL